MPRRCKLISPTNLLLEHPILSPVEECEYVLFGVKEFEKKQKELRDWWLQVGILVGVGSAGVFVAFVAFMVEIQRWIPK